MNPQFKYQAEQAERATKKDKGEKKGIEVSIAIISYIASGVFVFFGFHKMFAYDNPDSILKDSVNAYVGGDAYNYIINAGHATAYFVLALLFIVLGSSMLILNQIKKNGEK